MFLWREGGFFAQNLKFHETIEIHTWMNETKIKTRQQQNKSLLCVHSIKTRILTFDRITGYRVARIEKLWCDVRFEQHNIIHTRTHTHWVLLIHQIVNNHKVKLKTSTVKSQIKNTKKSRTWILSDKIESYLYCVIFIYGNNFQLWIKNT